MGMGWKRRHVEVLPMKINTSKKYKKYSFMYRNPLTERPWVRLWCIIGVLDEAGPEAIVRSRVRAFPAGILGDLIADNLGTPVEQEQHTRWSNTQKYWLHDYYDTLEELYAAHLKDII